MTMLAEAHADTENVPLSQCGIPIRNLWHMLMYAWNQVAIRNRWLSDIERAPSLDALLSTVLCRLMQQRIRIGLGRSYTEETRRLRGIRGRIDFGRSVKDFTFHRGEAFCTFDEFSVNVPKNQIARSTLDRIGRIGTFGSNKVLAEGLRQRMRRLVRDLEGIDLIPLTLDAIRRQQLGRNDNDYRVMLAICELLLLRHMPTEAAGDSVLPTIDRDTLTLHRVFEHFVARFYKIHLSEWRVRPQMAIDWCAGKASIYLPGMRPDVVFEHRTSGKIIVLDTKFTPNSLLVGRFGDMTFSSDHIYQMYAYLRSQEQTSENHRGASGILLYPTVKQELAEMVELDGHPIRFETVNLALPWQEIERRLLEVVTVSDSKHSPHVD